jgi:hypothetical protein
MAFRSPAIALIVVMNKKMKANKRNIIPSNLLIFIITSFHKKAPAILLKAEASTN